LKVAEVLRKSAFPGSSTLDQGASAVRGAMLETVENPLRNDLETLVAYEWLLGEGISSEEAVSWSARSWKRKGLQRFRSREILGDAGKPPQSARRL